MVQWLRLHASDAGGQGTKIAQAMQCSQYMCVCSVAKLCLTLCEPMDCSSPDSVLGFLQARILEWVAVSFSRRSS